MKIKKIFKQNLGILAVLLIIFISLKGCVKSTVSFNDYSAFERIDENSQVNRAFLIPDNELIVSKNNYGKFELALFFVRGENATNYFGSLYNIGKFPFGLRVFPNANGVWKTEIELKDKIGNVAESTFGRIGSKHNIKIIEKNDMLIIGTEQFHKINMDTVEISLLRNQFGN